MPRKRPVYYNVAPRYSGGSPAQVDFETAQRVADDEREGYDRSIHGVYGASYTVLAQENGLGGIVEERTELADCWIVVDMLTGDKFVRLFPQDKPSSLVDSLMPKWARRVARLSAKYSLPVETKEIAR